MVFQVYSGDPPEKQETYTASPGISRSPSLPYREVPDGPNPRLNPRFWTWKTWLIVGISVALLIVGGIVGTVFGARAAAYPNYYRIDYKLKDTYAGNNFFDNFDYFTGYDPTHGFVHYVDKPGSIAQNLTTTSSTKLKSLSSGSTAILRVDTSDKNATTGRRSVRISSKSTYSSGLFVFDVLHSPYGCATWPALWLSDNSNWPYNGEIDVMENVNVGDMGNQMTLHTSDGCKIGKSRKRKQSGKATSYDCHNTTNSNQGCGVRGPTSSYGQAFSDAGGGIYAMELRNEGIRVWLFNRTSIPADITNQNPDPSTWGSALADFPSLECDIGSHFKNMSIIANIDLCGDLAGQPNIFNENPTCTGTCSDWVSSHADSFNTAYWEFGGFWVYEAR